MFSLEAKWMNFIRYWLSTESETVSSPFECPIMAPAFEIDALNSENTHSCWSRVKRDKKVPIW